MERRKQYCLSARGEYLPNMEAIVTPSSLDPDSHHGSATISPSGGDAGQRSHIMLSGSGVLLYFDCRCVRLVLRRRVHANGVQLPCSSSHVTAIPQ